MIKCKDGSKKFSRDQLNDEFCDCPDGTDEPGMCKSMFLISYYNISVIHGLALVRLYLLNICGNLHFVQLVK